MTAEPTVFAVDPDGQVCYSIRRLAAMMNLPCETYNSGTQFLDCYDRSRAGCLVLEVKIPDIAGLEMQKRLASEEPSPPVIFLTGHASVSIAVRAMRAGAVHFFEKPLREDELWDAIREAMELDQQRRCAWAQQQELQRRLAQLTPKELRVLELIAEGKTKRSIAKEMDVGIRTTEIYKARMMKKLGLTFPDQLVHFAIVAKNGHGWCVPAAAGRCATDHSLER